MQTLARIVIYVALVVSAMGCHTRSELSPEELQLLRKNQWELDVYAVEVLNNHASVRVLGTEPSGHHGGHHSFKYERGEASWTLTESTFGIP